MADYTPHVATGRNPSTYVAGAAITGGEIVEVTGVNTVSPTAAASGVVAGVAAHDAAVGTNVTVWPLAGTLHQTISAAGVTAADGVEAGAGTIETVAVSIAASAAAGTLLGTALLTTAAGDPALWISR